jgi:hypothetical protein
MTRLPDPPVVPDAGGAEPHPSSDPWRVPPGDTLRSFLADAPSGARLRLLPGLHWGPFTFTRSVWLEGEAGVILDARGRGPCVHVEADDLSIRLRGLQLSGGAGPRGGGVCLEGWSSVELHAVRLEGSVAREGRGAGLAQSRGGLFAAGLRAGVGQDLLFSGVAEARLEGAELDAAIGLFDGADLSLSGGQFPGGVDLRGTTSRAPLLRLRAGASPSLRQHPRLPGRVERES